MSLVTFTCDLTLTLTLEESDYEDDAELHAVALDAFTAATEEIGGGLEDLRDSGREQIPDYEAGPVRRDLEATI